jgi:beta-D-xylosidase 4
VKLPPYRWGQEALHGIAAVVNDARTPLQSNVAFPSTLGCAFNRSLWHAIGAQLGREARAFINVGNAFKSFWPTCNVQRAPQWGRNLESPSEDPFVVAEYCARWVDGFQRSPADGGAQLQASAVCKHYLANELEAVGALNRHNVDVALSAQDLADTYLPPFQACVQQGRVSGLMCSYNAINGVPSCANKWLLTDLARDAWGGDLYVVADCDADFDVLAAHHYGGNWTSAVAAILKAGQDLDCGSTMSQYVTPALAEGLVTQAEVDAALTRAFSILVRAGHFDGPPSPLAFVGLDSVCSPGALALAQDSARQGAVLLKNGPAPAPLLPLPPARFPRALLVGPTAQLHDTWSYYGGPGCNPSAPFRPSPSTLLSEFAPRFPGGIDFLVGVPSVASGDTSGVPAAAAAAGAAGGPPLVALALGSDLLVEGEGLDRTSVALSAGQVALAGAVAAAAAAAGKPVLALVLGGGAIDVSCLLENPNVTAVVWLGVPGVQVGGAVRALFAGAAPGGVAGRLAASVYSDAQASAMTFTNFAMRPGAAGYPGRTHRFFTGTPVLPFGFGLSYTTWSYSAGGGGEVDLAGVQAEAEREAALGRVGSIPLGLQAPVVTYWVNVTNTGTVDSDDVVLGFLVPPGAGQNGVPLQELFGFERVFVPAGQTVTVFLGAQGVRFTQAGVDGVRRALRGEYRVYFGEKESAARGQGYAEAVLRGV